MASILDIRRRIRSVINTRQITRAMKMISAARLRRAQERALAARPYAQMLTNVLKSLPVHVRGSHLTLGAEVPRGFPRVMKVANAPTRISPLGSLMHLGAFPLARQS